MKELEMKWIPVKERLPEKDGKYLVGYRDYIGIESFTTDLLGLVHQEDGIDVHFSDEEDRDKIISGECSSSGFYKIEEERSYGEFFGDYAIFVYYNEECAWMPLPEPYEED